MPNKDCYQTPRLILRRWSATDRAAAAALLQDPEAMRFSVTGVHSVDQVQSWLEACQRDHSLEAPLGNWAIEQRADRQVLGYVKLIKDENLTASHEVELGIRLLPAGWGRGMAREAAMHLIAALFDTTDITRVLGVVDPSNHRSVALLKRLGMVYERPIMFPEYDYPDDLYALTRPGV